MIVEIDEIVNGCKSGDRKSQNSLVRMFAPRLMTVCKRYCPDEEHARDALQETFINAFRYIHSLREPKALDSWIRRIAVSSCISMHRRRQMPVFDEVVPESNILEAQIPDIYSQLSVEELMGMIKELPKAMALVFNLYVVEGYSHQEIADLLHIQESTSRAHLMRARLKLIDMIHNENESLMLKMAKSG